jgi:hypothetical protein
MRACVVRPQGLKPKLFETGVGTTEVVPFHDVRKMVSHF